MNTPPNRLISAAPGLTSAPGSMALVDSERAGVTP